MPSHFKLSKKLKYAIFPRQEVIALIDIQVQKEKTLPEEPATIEQFLEWCEEDIWAEWVDGEVIIMSPA